MSYNHAGPYIAPGEPPKKKSHKVRNSLLALLIIPPIVLLIGFVIGFALTPIPDPALDYTQPSGQTTTPAVPNKAPIPGDGMYLVPDEVKPGTYRSTANIDGICYWARLRNLTGDGDSTIANGMGDRQVVTIKPTDKAFETRGCGAWVKVR